VAYTGDDARRGFMNFEGRYIYVATGKAGFHAVAVAEHEEPPAILGSDFHNIEYPVLTRFALFATFTSSLRWSKLPPSAHRPGGPLGDLDYTQGAHLEEVWEVRGTWRTRPRSHETAFAQHAGE
jgi:hypothetical protein